jgi:hypothetical protein
VLANGWGNGADLEAIGSLFRIVCSKFGNWFQGDRLLEPLSARPLIENYRSI